MGPSAEGGHHALFLGQDGLLVLAGDADENKTYHLTVLIFESGELLGTQNITVPRLHLSRKTFLRQIPRTLHIMNRL